LGGIEEITIGAKNYSLTEGETIVMPAEIPHAVFIFVLCL
jgi:hypothetical protein